MITYFLKIIKRELRSYFMFFFLSILLYKKEIVCIFFWVIRYVFIIFPVLHLTLLPTVSENQCHIFSIRASVLGVNALLPGCLSCCTWRTLSVFFFSKLIEFDDEILGISKNLQILLTIVNSLDSKSAN